jgi:hypothetical protein
VLSAVQDEKTSEIAENIQSSEIINDNIDLIQNAVEERERACGIIALAAEPIYQGLFTDLKSALAPFTTSLNRLKTAVHQMLSNVQVESAFFAPVDLNVPYETSEFVIVMALPMLCSLICALAFVGSLFPGIFGENALEQIKWIILTLSVINLQLCLVIFALFGSLAGPNIPLFNIQVQMGKLMNYAIYSSLFCILAAGSISCDKILH